MNIFGAFLILLKSLLRDRVCLENWLSPRLEETALLLCHQLLGRHIVDGFETAKPRRYAFQILRQGQWFRVARKGNEIFYLVEEKIAINSSCHYRPFMLVHNPQERTPFMLGQPLDKRHHALSQIVL